MPDGGLNLFGINVNLPDIPKVCSTDPANEVCSAYVQEAAKWYEDAVSSLRRLVEGENGVKETYFNYIEHVREPGDYEEHVRNNGFKKVQRLEDLCPNIVADSTIPSPFSNIGDVRVAFEKLTKCKQLISGSVFFTSTCDTSKIGASDYPRVTLGTKDIDTTVTVPTGLGYKNGLKFTVSTTDAVVIYVVVPDGYTVNPFWDNFGKSSLRYNGMAVRNQYRVLYLPEYNEETRTHEKSHTFTVGIEGPTTKTEGCEMVPVSVAFGDVPSLP